MWAAGCILYTLLSGYQPFYAPYVADLIDLIKKGQYDFSGPAWESISDAAKDLVKKLLQTDPAKRATVHVALAHDWFTQAEDSTDVSYSNQQFRNNLLRNQRRLTRNFLPGLFLGKRVSETSAFVKLARQSTLLHTIHAPKAKNDD